MFNRLRIKCGITFIHVSVIIHEFATTNLSNPICTGHLFSDQYSILSLDLNMRTSRAHIMLMSLYFFLERLTT